MSEAPMPWRVRMSPEVFRRCDQSTPRGELDYWGIVYTFKTYGPAAFLEHLDSPAPNVELTVTDPFYITVGRNTFGIALQIHWASKTLDLVERGEVIYES